MKLNEYLEINKISQSAFSRLAQLDQAQISRFLGGLSKPSVEAAYKIYRATKKKVKMEEWVDDKIKSKRY